MYQPAQVLRRAAARLQPPPAPGYVPLATSWGAWIAADPTRVIGRSILTTRVFDLAVSEALARLVSPGDTVVDAGANVGYMTVLAAMAAGAGGRVLAFEPHPELFGTLQRNVAAARARFAIAETELHESALGESPGDGCLGCPSDFRLNDGLASLSARAARDGNSFTVRVDTLDRALGDRRADVLKVDVEGFEAQVLRGAARALEQRRIRHIVFEDFDVRESETVRLLHESGYEMFSLGWSINGPSLAPLATSPAWTYEAPSFLATLDPGQVVARWRPRGWLIFGRRLRRCARVGR